MIVPVRGADAAVGTVGDSRAVCPRPAVEFLAVWRRVGVFPAAGRSAAGLQDDHPLRVVSYREAVLRAVEQSVEWPPDDHHLPEVSLPEDAHPVFPILARKAIDWDARPSRVPAGFRSLSQAALQLPVVSREAGPASSRGAGPSPE